MSVEPNHTSVRATDHWMAAREVVSVLGLPEPAPFGPCAVVELAHGVSLASSGRGLDREGPDGHRLEIITRTSGSGA